MATFNAGYPVFCGAAATLPLSSEKDAEETPALIVGGGGGGGKHGVKNAISFFGAKAGDDGKGLTLHEVPPPRIDTDEVCCSALAVDCTGTLLVAALGDTLHFYLVVSLTEQIKVGEASVKHASDAKASEVVELTFDGSGHRFAVGHADGSVQGFDVENAESLRQSIRGGRKAPAARVKRLWRRELHDKQITSLSFSSAPAWPLERHEGPLLLSSAKGGAVAVSAGAAEDLAPAIELDASAGVPTKKKLDKVFCRGAVWLRSEGDEQGAGAGSEDEGGDSVTHLATGVGPARGPAYVGVWVLSGSKKDSLTAACAGLVKIADGPCSKIAACPWARLLAVGTSDGFVFCVRYDGGGALVPVYRTPEPNHSFPVTVLTFAPVPVGKDGEEGEDGDGDALWTIASASPDYNVAFLRSHLGARGGSFLGALLSLVFYLVLLAALAGAALACAGVYSPEARELLESLGLDDATAAAAEAAAPALAAVAKLLAGGGDGDGAGGDGGAEDDAGAPGADQEEL